MDTTVKTVSDLRAYLEKQGVRLVLKTGWFWKMLDFILKVLTFGKQKSFLTGYATTLGTVVGVPLSWLEFVEIPRSKLIVIEHELIHVKQARRFGFGNAWLGMPMMFLLYILLPLPVGFAWGRWVLEREAYLHDMKLRIQYGMDPKVEKRVEQMTNSSYFWTLLPFMKNYVRKWFEDRI